MCGLITKNFGRVLNKPVGNVAKRCQWKKSFGNRLGGHNFLAFSVFLRLA